MIPTKISTHFAIDRDLLLSVKVDCTPNLPGLLQIIPISRELL